MKSARMQKKAGNNVMGMIRAAGLGYEYLRYEEEGQEPEVTKAIEDVSLEIQKGQFIAVLGHNGSGKSTLAKHINALLVPTEGTMWVDDMKTTDEEDVWKIRQKAGMVFQNPDNQIIGNVVEEDVGFGPENLGVPTDEIWKRVEESLTATGAARTVMLCLFHDLPEARTGDFNYVNRLYDTSRERDALEDAVEGTGLEEDIMSIWDEHACRTTPESLLAHDADQLDLILNLKRESDLGNRYADKWLESAVERLRTDIAKGLAQTILKTDHTDWWYLGPDRNWWERKS